MIVQLSLSLSLSHYNILHCQTSLYLVLCTWYINDGHVLLTEKTVNIKFFCSLKLKKNNNELMYHGITCRNVGIENAPSHFTIKPKS